MFALKKMLIMKMEMSYQFGAFCNFVLPTHVTITKRYNMEKAWKLPY